MEEQSGRFLLLRIDLMAFNIKSSKSLLVIVSSSVSIVMQFVSSSIFWQSLQRFNSSMLRLHETLALLRCFSKSNFKFVCLFGINCYLFSVK